MALNLDLYCEEVLNIYKTSYNQICVRLSGVDEECLKHLIPDEKDPEDVLWELEDEVIISYLEERGYSVTQE